MSDLQKSTIYRRLLEERFNDVERYKLIHKLCEGNISLLDDIYDEELMRGMISFMDILNASEEYRVRRENFINKELKKMGLTKENN
jgi:uncharacterized membrane-anchored protein